MSFKLGRNLAALFAFLAALSVAVPGFGQTGGVVGKATKLDGNPCVKCRIVIQRTEIHAVYKTKTNKKGEYIYIGLPLGIYKIILESPEGKQLFYIEQKIGMGNPIQVDFDLPKLLASQKQEQQQEQAADQKAQQERMKRDSEYAKQVRAEQAAVKAAQEKQAKEEKEYKGLKALFDQAKTLYQQKDYTGAVAAFEKALPLAKGKNIPIVLSQLANAYHEAKENQKAVDTYQKVLQLTPDDPSLHNNLGSTYADMGKYQEAQAEFEKAAQLDPTHAAAYYYNIGVIMYNAGKMDEAVESFKKVTQLDPQRADAYFLEGQALIGKAKTGPHGEVVAPPGTTEAYEEYLKLAPNGPHAATARAVLQTLRGGVETQFKKKRTH